MIRLYWLGKATEPGLWALDTGAGTKRLRIDAIAAMGITREDDRLSEINPRAFVDVRSIDWIALPNCPRIELPTLELVTMTINQLAQDRSLE